MNSNIMKSTVIKIYILLTSYFFGLLIWPSISYHLKIYDPFGCIFFNYLLLCSIFFILDLYRIKNKNPFNYIMKFIILLAFLIEGIGLQISLPEFNSMLCMIPSLYAYNGLKVAFAASVTGGLFIFIYLISSLIYQIKKSIEKPKKYHDIQEKDRNQKERFIIQDNSLFYISISLLFFHISFLIPSIFESIGCNGIPDNSIPPVGLFWIFPGIFSIIYLLFLMVRRLKIRLAEKRALLISHD